MRTPLTSSVFCVFGETWSWKKNLVLKLLNEIHKASRKPVANTRQSGCSLLPSLPLLSSRSKQETQQGTSPCTDWGRLRILFQNLEQLSRKWTLYATRNSNRRHTLGADLEFSAESINPRRPAETRLGLFIPAGEGSDGSTLCISDRGLVATRAGLSNCSACARPLSPAVNLLGLLWTPSVQTKI